MSEHSDSMLFPWETDTQSTGEPPVPSAPADAHPEADAPVGDAAADAVADLKETGPHAHEHAAEITAAPEEHGATRRAERPLVRKEYYAISEVADLVGLPAHVLRYWESQFSVLNPSKNRSGNRVYQRKEIRLILLVKQLLYDEKYTVEGAKQKLEQLRRGGALTDATGRALDTQLVRVLRDDVRTLLQILAPDTV